MREGRGREERGGGAEKMAAARAYNAAQSWEACSSLSPTQLATVATLSKRCKGIGEEDAFAHIPLPIHIQRERQQKKMMEELEKAATKDDTKKGANDAGSGHDIDADTGSSELTEVLSTTSSFYTWWRDQEAAVLREKEMKYMLHGSRLKDTLDQCKSLRDAIDSVLEYLDQLRVLHRSVGSKSQSLNVSCEKLTIEERKLEGFADALRAKLEYFDEFDRLSPQCNTSNIISQLQRLSDSNSQNEHRRSRFFMMMRRLDECINFVVVEHPQYQDSAMYATKFRQLQSKALQCVKHHVCSVLKNATKTVMIALKEVVDASIKQSGDGDTAKGDGSNYVAESKGSLPEGMETSILYVKFRAAITDLRPVIAEIENRARATINKSTANANSQYLQLLSDCHSEYCEHRLALCMPVVEQRMYAFAAPGKSLDSLVRSGCAYLLLLGRQEQQLFEFLFHASIHSDIDNEDNTASVATTGNEPLNELLEPLADVLYDIIRPSVLSLTDIDYICDLVNILKVEVMEEQIGQYGSGLSKTSGLMQVMTRILADMQERLIFRAQNFIRDDVSGYRQKEEDLNYPECLIESDASSTTDEKQDDKSLKPSPWYPPVSLTLSMLAKLYKCVDKTIFSGLAQEAIAACTSVVREGHRQLSRRKGSISLESSSLAEKSDEKDAASSISLKSTYVLSFDPKVDTSLFLIRQLLILKEQITPFEVDMCVIEKELDFSHMADHLMKIAVRHIRQFLQLPYLRMLKMLYYTRFHVASANVVADTIYTKPFCIRPEVNPC